MPIKIIIETSGSEDVKDANNPLTEATKKESQDKKVNGKISPEMAMVSKFAISQAKTWALEGIKSYSNYTGNTQMQKRAEFALSALDDVATIFAGIKLGGVIGGAIAVGTIAGRKGIQDYQNYMEIKIHNRDLSIVTQGLGARNINGGRYGN